MTVLLIVLLVIGAMLFLVVGVDAKYDGHVSVALCVGPFRLNLATDPENIKPKKTGKKKKSAKEEQPGEKQDKTRRIDKTLIFDMIPVAIKGLGRFKRKLCIDLLAFHFTAGSSDPYKTVMQYGRVCAAMGSIVPMVERQLNVRERDIRADLDINAEKPEILVHIITTLAIWEGIYIGVSMGIDFLKIYIPYRKQQKQKASEQTSNLTEIQS